MKIRTEISEDGQEEIIIRCPQRTEKIKSIETALERLILSHQEMLLYLSGAEYYVPTDDILFFESGNGKVYAHTRERMFTTDRKLFELEAVLPPHFARISKSTIANVMKISSLRRDVVGTGEITFKGCEKKTYFSRGYYKILRDKIDEMRLGK